ncbi:drug/metabolite transporter (DMT)-like permease [Rhizobium rosettiformans]|uniref:DMT family transporter n=2 Tax=Rhizobium rosettiformans TaxID=1368430 RepID=A0A4S8Q2P0_9HYPH|nr:DMT family transporter [Rhizobium rosettiformans]MBB5276114.1 drug/metabolite transporter (DMT)-like permease [Rhizobium rosettiformans]THV36755.1 DMT family transporter [Rhizobium rosettiformans W3]
MTTSWKAWASGFIGVLIFSGSLPATRVGLADFAPLFLTSARAVIAAVLGAALLVVLREKRPARSDLLPLAVVALGVVVGFPLLTALALQSITSAQSIVFIGLLPLCTALFGVLRAGERPSVVFWMFSVTGAALVAGFALSTTAEMSVAGAGLMIAAVLACGLGYAEGARLSRRLGGWQVISWALVLSLPVMLPLALWTMPEDLAAVSSSGWFALAYVSLLSMMIGFIFWYRGLALGGIASVGQLQLLQPFLGFVLAAGLLHEKVSLPMLTTALLVVLCVAGSRRFA